MALHAIIPCVETYVVAPPPGWDEWLGPVWALTLFASGASGLVVSIVAMWRVKAPCAGRRHILLLVCLAGCALYNLIAAGAVLALVLIVTLGVKD